MAIVKKGAVNIRSGDFLEQAVAVVREDRADFYRQLGTGRVDTSQPHITRWPEDISQVFEEKGSIVLEGTAFQLRVFPPRDEFRDWLEVFQRWSGLGEPVETEDTMQFKQLNPDVTRAWFIQDITYRDNYNDSHAPEFRDRPLAWRALLEVAQLCQEHIGRLGIVRTYPSSGDELVDDELAEMALDQAELIRSTLVKLGVSEKMVEIGVEQSDSGRFLHYFDFKMPDESSPPSLSLSPRTPGLHEQSVSSPSGPLLSGAFRAEFSGTAGGGGGSIGGDPNRPHLLELHRNRLLLYQAFPKVAPRLVGDVRWASVDDLEVLDDGFIVHVAGGTRITLKGPLGEDLQPWLSQMEELLKGKEAQRRSQPGSPQFGTPHRSGFIEDSEFLLSDDPNDVLPLHYPPIYEGFLEVRINDGSEFLPRHLVLDERSLTIFSDTRAWKRNAPPTNEVFLSELQTFKVEDEGFNIYCRNGDSYVFRSPDVARRAAWLKAWGVALHPECAVPMSKEEVPFVHRGSILLKGTNVGYGVSYPDRLELFSSATFSKSSTAPRRTLWLEEVTRIQVYDSGFIIGLARGTAELDVPYPQDLETWADVLKGLLTDPSEQSPADSPHPLGSLGSSPGGGGGAGSPSSPSSPSQRVIRSRGQQQQQPATTKKSSEECDMDAWVEGLLVQPILFGDIRMQPAGSRATDFAALFKDNLDFWDSAGDACANRPPSHSVWLRDVTNLSSNSRFLALVCGPKRRYNICITPGPEMKKWFNELLALCSPNEENSRAAADLSSPASSGARTKLVMPRKKTTKELLERENGLLTRSPPKHKTCNGLESSEIDGKDDETPTETRKLTPKELKEQIHRLTRPLDRTLKQPPPEESEAPPPARKMPLARVNSLVARLYKPVYRTDAADEAAPAKWSPPPAATRTPSNPPAPKSQPPAITESTFSPEARHSLQQRTSIKNTPAQAEAAVTEETSQVKSSSPTGSVLEEAQGDDQTAAADGNGNEAVPASRRSSRSSRKSQELQQQTMAEEEKQKAAAEDGDVEDASAAVAAEASKKRRSSRRRSSAAQALAAAAAANLTLPETQHLSSDVDEDGPPKAAAAAAAGGSVSSAASNEDTGPSAGANDAAGADAEADTSADKPGMTGVTNVDGKTSAAADVAEESGTEAGGPAEAHTSAAAEEDKPAQAAEGRASTGAATTPAGLATVTEEAPMEGDAATATSPGATKRSASRLGVEARTQSEAESAVTSDDVRGQDSDF